MRAQSEIRTGLSILLVVQLLLAFGSMGLLSRMSPTVERIVKENITSIEATQQMLTVLATQSSSEEDIVNDRLTDEESFEDALQSARTSAHSVAERDAIHVIDSSWKSALEGNHQAKITTIHALSDLAETHRHSVYQANQETRRLGAAGAWATALLGFIAFCTSLYLIRRFNQRLAAPLVEVKRALEEIHRGDPYRRCRRIEATSEYTTIAMRLNQLLDRRLAKEEAEDPQLAAMDRTLLHHLLDRSPDPVVAVDGSGALIAASQEALDLLSQAGDTSLADVLATGIEGDSSLIQKVEPFGRPDGFLITLKRPAGFIPTPLISGEQRTPAPRISNPFVDRPSHTRTPEPRPMQPKPDREDWERD